MQSLRYDERILSIDIGGSRIKATILDPDGKMLMDYQKIATPITPDPGNVIQAILELTQNFQEYHRVSVGFPGYTRQGIIHTAPNLGTPKWSGVNLTKLLSDVLNKPVRVLNDADMQGMGVIRGEGLEMVITLGTGFGTALFLEGNLLPHLEIAHHPVSKDRTYDQYIGDKALDEAGLEKWNRRLKKVIGILKTVFNYDSLYIGGGNSKKISFEIENNITIVSNIDGIKGGAKVWQREMYYAV
ncbi:ROK family protein [Chryseolinea sp. H1M3-3]|uniref:ROK family protein n=1 Tax=Chryseolinea sp. H1M3-3 TaxID=3034144 RepID=UPI0023ED3946|nr:ROK family protein [Chryseolinea sp. H1M3-3]